MQGFVAKQQAQQDSSQRGITPESDTDVDIDGAMPSLGMQDMKALNSKLAKLAVSHSISLVQQDQLLLLLGSFDAIMQQGDALLISSGTGEVSSIHGSSHMGTLYHWQSQM